MIFQSPTLTQADQDVLALIREQRGHLQYQVAQTPNRWTGFLRRNAFARTMQGSNSIEGYNASLADAVEIVDNNKPETMEEETASALFGYRTAVTYILQIHSDPHFELNAQVIKSLHYMMLSYDLTKLPGKWRPGSVFIINEPSGKTVYEGPEADLVPSLIRELMEQIETPDGHGQDPIVKAAMAHLNLTMIHPFKDGNGRMARALQTLVLARDGGILSPVFCSIEEWLGRNTQAYYDILAAVGCGHWHPENDALPWVRFCLVAHYQQAATLIKRNNEIGSVWLEISDIVKKAGMPERCEPALVDAAFNFRVRNSRYREEQQISDVVASRDLKKLCDLGLLVPVGEKRGRYYLASPQLKKIREAHRDPRKAPDPYAIVAEQPPRMSSAQLDLPGVV